jgi:hypothetical protein
VNISTTSTSARAANRWLTRYLQDHYVASRGELELFERCAGSLQDPHLREEVSALAREATEDRAALLAVMESLDVPEATVQEQVAVLAERVGRLKPNGTLVRRSPLSDLVELEGLTVAVRARRAAWTALRAVAPALEVLNPYHLEQLVDRADDQEARLEQLRVVVAQRVLAGSEEVQS